MAHPGSADAFRPPQVGYGGGAGPTPPTAPNRQQPTNYGPPPPTHVHHQQPPPPPSSAPPSPHTTTQQTPGGNAKQGGGSVLEFISDMGDAVMNHNQWLHQMQQDLLLCDVRYCEVIDKAGVGLYLQLSRNAKPTTNLSLPSPSEQDKELSSSSPMPESNNKKPKESSVAYTDDLKLIVIPRGYTLQVVGPIFCDPSSSSFWVRACFDNKDSPFGASKKRTRYVCIRAGERNFLSMPSIAFGRDAVVVTNPDRRPPSLFPEDGDVSAASSPLSGNSKKKQGDTATAVDDGKSKRPARTLKAKDEDSTEDDEDSDNDDSWIFSCCRNMRK